MQPTNSAEAQRVFSGNGTHATGRHSPTPTPKQAHGRYYNPLRERAFQNMGGWKAVASFVAAATLCIFSCMASQMILECIRPPLSLIIGIVLPITAYASLLLVAYRMLKGLSTPIVIEN
jgi:hypothetical protein